MIEEGAYFKGLTITGPSQSADELLQTAASLIGEPLWHATASPPLVESESGTKQLAYDQVQEKVIRQTLPG